jgi:hypothetical protein
MAKAAPKNEREQQQNKSKNGDGMFVPIGHDT